jgi:hypothetical protein
MHKLIVVHPHECYDQALLTQASIREVVMRFPVDAVMVLVNPEEEDADTYLDYHDTFNHIPSHEGHIPHRFRQSYFRDTSEITIIGHTGCYCHHTAFEDVLEELARLRPTSVAIHLPAHAISREYHDDGVSMCDAITERVTRKTQHTRPSGYPDFLTPPQDEARTQATMWQFLDYLRVAKFRTNQGYFTLNLVIDGAHMRSIGEGETVLTITITTT